MQMATVRKHSRKRDAILACVRSTTCHPTADWVYQRLKPEIPDLSLGTVYRNLSMFKDEGLIISVGTVGGLERFDGNTSPHTHFVCTRCSAVLDLMDVNLEDDFLQKVHNTAGGRITDYRLSVYGLCTECMKADTSASYKNKK